MPFSPTLLSGALAHFGYLAIFLGTLLEGETVVIAAGFFAHKGMLSLDLVILAAFLGSVTSDQGLFFLSRKQGWKLLHKRPKTEEKVKHLMQRLHSHPHWLLAFALLFRFIYGIRNIAPIALGLSTLPTSRFIAANVIGALVWAILFSYAGFSFSAAITRFGPQVHYAELALLGAACALVGGIVWWRTRKASRK